MIIQRGPTVIAGLVLSSGSESLLTVAPASIYVMPGTVVVDLGLRAFASANHCEDAASTHMRRLPNHLGVSRHAGETVAALTPNYGFALGVRVDDPG